MKQGHFAQHWVDEYGNPGGGVSTGKGFTISWQNGPLGALGTADRREANGAFVEDVIQAVIERIEFYQASRFACDANAEALVGLQMAADALARRTRDRESRQVEGTHAV
jgi:hypothetical protein